MRVAQGANINERVQTIVHRYLLRGKFSDNAGKFQVLRLTEVARPELLCDGHNEEYQARSTGKLKMWTQMRSGTVSLVLRIECRDFNFENAVEG